MQTSALTGYDLPNTSKSRTVRMNPPKLTAKDKLPEFTPTMPDPFVQTVLDILSKHSMLDMMKPDLWKWVPQSKLDDIIQTAQSVIPSGSPIKPLSKRHVGNFTNPLFTQKDSSSSGSGQANTIGSPGSIGGTTGAVLQSTPPPTSGSSSGSNNTEQTLTDLQTNISQQVDKIHVDTMSDKNEFSKVLDATKASMPNRFQKLLDRSFEEYVTWYNTKTLDIEDRDRRIFRFQIDDLIREKVKSSHSYLYDKVIKGDFPVILMRMMSTHQNPDPVLAGELINKFFDQETYVKRQSEPLSLWFARISNILEQLKSSGAQLSDAVIRARVINYLKADRRYTTLIIEAEENQFSLTKLIQKCFIRATTIKDIPKDPALKAKANATQIEDGKGKKGKSKRHGKRKPPSSGSVCYTFKEKGTCQYGDKCIHFHGNPDPRIAIRDGKAATANATQSDSDGSKTNSVKAESGDSTTDSPSTTIVAPATANVATTTTTNASSTEISQRDSFPFTCRRICVEWSEEGTCKFGDNCKFDHIGPGTNKAQTTANIAVISTMPIMRQSISIFAFDTKLSSNEQDFIARLAIIHPLSSLNHFNEIDIEDNHINESSNDEARAFVAAKSKNSSGLLDSGTSRTMLPDTPSIRSLAIHGSFKRLNNIVTVSTANKDAPSLIAAFSASFCIADPFVKPRQHVVLRDCLLVPGLSRTLVSLNDLTAIGYTVVFHDTDATIYDDGTKVLVISRQNTPSELYELPLHLLIQPSFKREAHKSKLTSWTQFRDFHVLMGHIHNGVLVPIFKSMTGLTGHPDKCKCPDCGVAKTTRTTLPSHRRHIATRPLEHTHTDVCGPFRVRSVFGHRYFIIVVEEYFDFYILIPIRQKSEFPLRFQEVLEHLENVHQPLKATWVYADNALNTNDFRAYATKKGIGVRLTAPYKSIQNGSAERANRTVYEGGQAMRHHSGLPPSMLIPACLYFVYIRNHLPRQKEHFSKVDTSRPLSPIERMNRYDGGKWEAHLSFILPFGCECFTLRPGPARPQGKTSYRGERGIIIGRANDRKCWLVLSLSRQCFINVYDLVSNDTNFPFRRAMELPPRFPKRSSLVSDPPIESDMDSGREIPDQPDDQPEDEETFIEVDDFSIGENNLKDASVNVEQPAKADHDLTSEQPLKTDHDLTGFGFGQLPSPIEQHDMSVLDTSVNKRLDFSALDALEEAENNITVPVISSEETDNDDDFVPIAKTKGTRTLKPSAKMLDVIQEREERPDHPESKIWEPKFNTGDIVQTFKDGPCLITKPYENNKLKSYEVTFPEWEKPGEAFTVSEKELLAMHSIVLPVFNRLNQSFDSIKDECPNFDLSSLNEHKAFAHDTNVISLDASIQYSTMSSSILDNIHTDDAMYWRMIEHPSGVLLPSGEFTIGDIISPSEMATKPRLACSHHADTHQRPVIGITMADQVSLPRFDFEVARHPLKDDLQLAMDREFQKQVNNETWDSNPIELPKGEKVIGLMWVFTAKSNPDGTFKRLNARLTLRGDQQKIDLNPGESYSPVMALTAFRILLSLYCADSTVIFRQMDIVGAYLTAGMKRKVYIRMPNRYTKTGTSHLVYLLHKAMYGGADSGRLFYDDVLKFHKEMGFETIWIENCFLSIEKPNGDFIKCLFHVDDFVYACRGKELWDWYLNKLTSKYTVKLGELTSFLGIHVFRNPTDGSFKLDVDTQVGKLARAFSLDKVRKFPSTPVAIYRPTDKDIPRTEDELLAARKIPYQSAVGHLNYLQVIAYPEISYALKIASRYTTSYGVPMWNWVKHIMLYVIGRKYNSTYIRGNPVGIPRLIAYTDADHAACIDTRRSLSGYFVLLNEDVISYACHRQRMVAHSSSESEIMALDSCLREVQYIRQLVHLMGGPDQDCVTVYIDNESVIMASKNPLQPGRNRHMPIRFFYFKELSQERVIELQHVSSKNNMADLLVTFKTVANFVHFTKQAKGLKPIEM